jgi:AraC family transcriptional regulator
MSPNREHQLAEYRARINRVIDYIEANISRELSLKELAGVAHFSPFHFHRIFSAMVGEPLNGFIQRIRLEKAAMRLAADPKKSVTEAAFEGGFSSSSAFARAFKEGFGMSASQWRRKVGQVESKTGQAASKPRQDFEVAPFYTQNINKMEWRVTMKESNLKADVEVKEMPEMHVAYVRHIGPYKGGVELFANLFNKLMSWAGPRGLLSSPEVKVLTIYHDNPEITDQSRLRTDACITVPADTKVDGEIGKATLAAGKYAIAHFEISADQYQDAWNAVYGGWLPGSGYQPTDGPVYEHYLNQPQPGGKHMVNICVPVKPL